MSTIIKVADAVVASLNAGPFEGQFKAERKYQPIYDLSTISTLRVTVVPKSLAIETASRQSSYFDCAVDVGVQKKIDPSNLAEGDALTDLVEKIADHLRNTPLSDMPEACRLSIANEPVFAPEHMDQRRVFTSVLTVTYRVRR